MKYFAMKDRNLLNFIERKLHLSYVLGAFKKKLYSNNADQKSVYLEVCYNTTYIQHTTFLHNLRLAVDICRRVALIVLLPDDRKWLVGPETSLEQLSEPGHRWEILFHSNVV